MALFLLTPQSVYAKKIIPQDQMFPRVLMYHEVMETIMFGETRVKNFSISPEHFEEQLKYIADNNVKTLFVSEFILARERRGKKTQKSVVLTFDDGTQDVFDDVFPLIKKYNVKITIFVNPGFDGTNGRMTHTELRKLSDSGLVEVAAHTMKHVQLQEISDDDARREIIDSKNLIEKITGKKVQSFAYPFGAFGYREEKMVAETGISVAFAADERHGRNYRNLLALPRTMIHDGTTMELFKQLLRGR